MSGGKLSCLSPDWPAPARVRAGVTLRSGGFSDSGYRSFNPADHVGDDPAAVLANRRLLQEYIGSGHPLFWLRQVHGNKLVSIHGENKIRRDCPEADAIYTAQSNIACAILTADCLPVFFCSKDGREVALAHAGWRGLAAGVLENTLAAFQAGPDDILVWFGPAIGPCHFEVGNEVRQAFLDGPGSKKDLQAAFIPGVASGKWMADIYRLGKCRLQALGLHSIYGGGHCTVCEEERFFSFRRDRQCGRNASFIYLI